MIATHHPLSCPTSVTVFPICGLQLMQSSAFLLLVIGTTASYNTYIPMYISLAYLRSWLAWQSLFGTAAQLICHLQSSVRAYLGRSLHYWRCHEKHFVG